MLDMEEVASSNQHFWHSTSASNAQTATVLAVKEYTTMEKYRLVQEHIKGRWRRFPGTDCKF
jgi:hypothetical protein